jgi:hypothetical protein
MDAEVGRRHERRVGHSGHDGPRKRTARRIVRLDFDLSHDLLKRRREAQELHSRRRFLRRLERQVRRRRVSRIRRRRRRGELLRERRERRRLLQDRRPQVVRREGRRDRGRRRRGRIRGLRRPPERQYLEKREGRGRFARGLLLIRGDSLPLSFHARLHTYMRPKSGRFRFRPKTDRFRFR